MWTNGHLRWTFGFGRKQSYHISSFGMLLLVNSVVAESRVQSLSCGGRECARCRESVASLCTDWLCKDNWWSWLRCLRLHLVLQLTLLLAYVFDLLFRLCGLGPDTIDFRFRFSAESHALLSVAQTVSAECVTSLSAYFRFRPKVKLSLSVDLYHSGPSGWLMAHTDQPALCHPNSHVYVNMVR